MKQRLSQMPASQASGCFSHSFAQIRPKSFNQMCEGKKNPTKQNKNTLLLAHGKGKPLPSGIQKELVLGEELCHLVPSGL